MRYEPQNGECETCSFLCKGCGECMIYGNADRKEEQCRKDFSVAELKRIEKRLQYLPKKTQEEIREDIEDQEIRIIFTYRIIEHQQWFVIGEKLSVDRRTVARKFDGFLKKVLIKKQFEG